MYNSCDIDVTNRHLQETAIDRSIERVYLIISYACDDRNPRSTMSACRPLTE